MKIRIGFVSNSSSSSFIIGTDKKLPNGLVDVVRGIIAEHPDQAAEAILNAMIICPCDEGLARAIEDKEEYGDMIAEFQDYKYLYELRSPNDCYDFAAEILKLNSDETIKIVDNN
jgi:transposase